MIRRPPRSTLLSLHDALPISTCCTPPSTPGSAMTSPTGGGSPITSQDETADRADAQVDDTAATSTGLDTTTAGDRKSKRLNSSYANISYAVFCLKKNTKN